MTVLFPQSYWCWWTTPRAVDLDGDLYTGGVRGDGSIHVHSLRSATGVTNVFPFADWEDDDHNNPAILVAAGKPVVGIYSRHSADSVLRIRRGSQNVEDGIDDFGAVATLTHADGVTSYASAHPVGDTVHLLARSGAGNNWSYTKSTDWAATWGTPQPFVNTAGGQKIYVASRLSADNSTLRFAVSKHPAGVGENQQVFYGEINLSTGDISQPGGAALGNLDGTNLPITWTSFEQVSSLTGDTRSWVFDVSNGANPVVLFCDFEDEDPDGTGMYRYAVRTGGSWVVRDIVATGEFFFDDGGPNHYPSGVQCTADGTSVYLTRKVSGTWRVERWDTADEGESWTTTVLATSSDILARAWPVEGDGSSGYECVFGHLTKYDAFTDFDGYLDAV